jgi:hypothetical protein
MKFLVFALAKKNPSVAKATKRKDAIASLVQRNNFSKKNPSKNKF